MCVFCVIIHVCFRVAAATIVSFVGFFIVIVFVCMGLVRRFLNPLNPFLNPFS